MSFSYLRIQLLTLSIVLTVGGLFGLAPAAQAQQCSSVHLATGMEAWQNPLLAKRRFEAVIAHQNQIRESKGAPKLSHDVQKESPLLFSAEVIGEYPDDPTVGTFLVHGDSVIRGHYNDTFLLNFVYTFKGEKLIEVKSYTEWILERLPGLTYTLYRRMSVAENKLWTSKEFRSLGSEWGYGKKIVFFSTNQKETTSPLPDEAPLMELRVPREVLLKLAQEKKIWSGILNEENLTSEIVLPADLLENLFKAGQIQFRNVQ